MSCPDCFKGAIHDHAGDPQGTMQTMYSYPCYVASPPPSSTTQSTIIFFCDAFGLNLINNKLLCDHYASQTGFRVIAPDIIPGGPAPVSLMADMENLLGKTISWWDIWGQLLRIITALRIFSIFVPFLIRSGPWTGYPVGLKFARAVRADLPLGAKLGVTGFCWGGYLSTGLCAEPAVEGGKERLIDAQFCGHPSGLSTPGMVVDAVKKFGTAYSMAIGDKDFVYSEKKVLQTEAALRREVGEPKDNDYEIRTYKGCGHGFAVRAQPDNKLEMAALELARQQAVSWFRKYL
jgi:dienelactone hydrolase